MAKESAPAFQFYARDWLASGSVAMLTLEERGAYITLLARCWLMVELPLDAAELASLAGTDVRWWAKHGERVMRQFTKGEAGYRHGRLDEERLKQAAYSEQQSGRATGGWRKRRGNAGVMPGQCPADALHLQSSSASASAVPEAVASGASLPPLHGKPLAYKPRIDVAWPGKPPVPGILHAEFRSKLAGDPNAADARLRAWYPVAAAEWADRDIGDDDFVFWKARFREWIGTTVRPVVDGPAQIDVDQMLRNIHAKDERLKGLRS